MSNSVIGYNFGAVGTTGDTGGFGPNGKLGPAGPTGATGGIGPTGASVSEVIVGDLNGDGLQVKTVYTNGVSVISSDVEGEGTGGGGGIGGIGGNESDASLGPLGNFVYKLFTEDIGTAGATALVKGLIDGCYIGTIELKTIKGTGGIVVTENEDEILVGYRDNKQIVGVTPSTKNQIAYMTGIAGNSAEALPLVRGASGLNYNPEKRSINAVGRKYREVGFRFGMTEVSGGFINDSTRIIEFNVDPGLHLGTRYVRENQYGPSGPWGNTWFIDVNEIYASQIPLLPNASSVEGASAPFIKINDVTATADTFEHYFGSGRASSFTLAIKGGSNRPRDDGKTCGVVWPANWIFPYKVNPVLTTGLDVYQFYSLGKKDTEKRTVWYGVPLKSSSGTDIFFPTY